MSMHAFRMIGKDSWLTYVSAACLIAVAAPAAAQSAAVATAPASAASNTVAQNATAPAAAPASQLQEVIVTGTREVGVTAENSAAPVTVLSAVALQHVGTQNVQQALEQTTPSFQVTHVGGDLANLTLSAALRGLSPNDTLVLVNGKRRHGTANLNLGTGGAAPDLGFIPSAAIDHIEVLTEGAAAQYGTDAIAGVINIILKSQKRGGQITLTGGQRYSAEGQTYDLSGFIGHSIGENGFIDVTLEKRWNNYTQQGTSDSRLFDAFGRPIPQPYTAAIVNVKGPSGLPGYPDLNRISGDSRQNLNSVLVNAGYNFTPDIQLYDFGTYGSKFAQAYENWRPPNAVVASPVLGVAGTYGTAGAIVPFPQGFSPQEVLSEEDYADTLGIKGDPGNWHYDLSSTYGKDNDGIYTYDSIVRSLFINTHFSPSQFYDGSLISTEWTNNLDISYTFNTHIPVTVAVGGEQRQDRYTILEGDAGSVYQEGPQGYPGFTANDVGSHTRTNIGGYLDVALNPVEAWSVEAAGRAEHYTDFGSTHIGEFTTRYNFSPRFALRGTVQNGFRAPTIAEEYYTTTNVDPSYARVQLPANSPASRLLGLPSLQPETSTSFSVGLVAEPLQGLHLVLDAYSIAIRGHIASSPTLYCKGGAVNSPAVCAALLANGNVLDPTAAQQEASLLTNTTNTETRGIDLTANYPTDFGRFGNVQWTLLGNYNDTYITKVPSTPPELAPTVFFQPYNIQNENDNYSKYEVKLNALWSYSPKLSANLVETMYGPLTNLATPNGGAPFYPEYQSNAFLTDLEFDYQVNHALRVAVGGQNIFDKIPPSVPNQPNGKLVSFAVLVNHLPQSARYGAEGGYYYARLQVSF